MGMYEDYADWHTCDYDPNHNTSKETTNNVEQYRANVNSNGNFLVPGAWCLKILEVG